MKKRSTISAGKAMCILSVLAIIILLCVLCVIQFNESKTVRELCVAIQAGNIEHLEVLLQEGADANGTTRTIFYLPVSIVTESNALSTPLLTACESGNPDAVALLLKYNADPNKRVAGGFNALEAVYNTDTGRAARFETIPILLDYGVDLTYAASLTRTDHVAFREVFLATDDTAAQSIALLELYTNIPESLTDASGTTLLGKCHSPIVADWLIRKGADVNAANDNGNTPLMYAAERGYREIIEVLILNGANTALKNNAGKTAYDLARENGFTELSQMLSPAD